MRILVLGGTSFVGRAIVEDALAHGHELTLFSRGITGADLFPEVTRARGDRESGDYTSLYGTTWDAVIDVTAYLHRHVSQSLDALGERFSRYVLISTGSVYDHLGAPASGLDEQCPRLAAEYGTEEITGETYGPLKVACEDVAVARLGDRVSIVRPGIVAGPHDPSDRFTWWVRAAAQGGDVRAPVRAEQPVQVVDSRDLARLVVSLCEGDRSGAYNAVGPTEAITMASLVAICAAAAGTTARLVPTPPQEGIPLGLSDPAWDPMFRRTADRAYAAGMPQTPLAVTAADVLVWDRARGLPPLTVSVGSRLPAPAEETRMDLVALHATADGEFAARVHAIRDEQWSAQTPCEDWDVRALVNHSVYEMLWVPELLGGATIVEVGDRFDGDVLGEHPARTAVAAGRAAHEAIAATPMEKMVNVSWGQITAAEYIGQFVTDMAVHGWDLARAIGYDDTIDPTLVDDLLPGVEASQAALTASGMFGTPVEVPADADPQTRLLAMLGRRR